MIPTSGFGGRAQWVAGPAVVHEKYSGDRKVREIKVPGVNGDSRTIWKDVDPAWVSLANGPRTVASKDGKQVAFTSDRSGWAHLYVIPFDATSESQARQLSKGSFGDGFAAWSPDSRKVAFAHSEPGNQQERFLSVADVGSGKVQPIVTARGVNYGRCSRMTELPWPIFARPWSIRRRSTR